ncbi:MAG: DUF2061 domain-containing protein [Bacteroidetes bacterium]|nr:MAG: DUF2061 domain-containing protein [Bacteroidota bacterium]
MKDKSHKRHITKTITWRTVGTLDTILLSWLITGNPFTGLKIGLVEIITKMILYYFHERIWFRSRFKNSNQRHLLKTVTWRILGTLDTILIAWVITGNGLIGLKIGFAEVVTKMILYYLHEKVWYKIDFGLENRKKYN